MKVNEEFKNPNNLIIQINKPPNHQLVVGINIAKRMIEQQEEEKIKEQRSKLAAARLWVFKGKALKKRKEYIVAKMWFEKAHQLEYEEGSLCLAELYKEGLGTEKDIKKAFSLIFPLLKKKNIRAITLMAQLYLYEPQQFNNSYNQSLVFRLLKNAASLLVKAKDPTGWALFQLVKECYEKGMGVEKNLEKAKKYQQILNGINPKSGSSRE